MFGGNSPEAKENQKLLQNVTFDHAGQVIAIKAVNALSCLPAKREMTPNQNFKVNTLAVTTM
jgi:hypothetical protein